MGRHGGRDTRTRALACAAAALAMLAFAPSLAAADTALPAGFAEATVIDGLVNPTTVRFLPSGAVLVAEKRGVLLRFDDLSDTSPTTVLDLRTDVHNFWDRGLLGLAIDPNYATNRFIYILYARDAAIGGATPRWGHAGDDYDDCPESSPPTEEAPGGSLEGCVISGRLERLQLTASGLAVVPGGRTTLVDDWCQQFPSHSIGSLAFDSAGMLYASAGDGASFDFADYGQEGLPPNPCGDPPGGVGGAQTPPSAEGGSLRAQDLRSTSDPAGLDGSVIRVDPSTGAAAPGNPLDSSSDLNARRIVAYGLRNPYRMAFRPGSDDLWIGDVGWGATEEINRLAHLPGTAVNYGWPCYEGAVPQDGFSGLGLSMCESLYLSGAATPYYEYEHDMIVAPGDGCAAGTSAITGLAFTPTGNFPARYDGGLFFADYSRNCIWAMRDGDGDGVPDPNLVEGFGSAAAAPVDLVFGPDGALYYVGIGTGGADGTVRRIGFNGPTAVLEATPTSGDAPLQVQFDGSGSSDPDDDVTQLDFDWDLDGDGQYDDATVEQPTHTYTDPGSFTVRLRVTDPAGSQGFDSIQIDVSNTPPEPRIDSPAPGSLWKVGDTIDFSGSATDDEDGDLAPSALSWNIVIFHCPAGCHEHSLTARAGTDEGAFVAPDHEYPSRLALRLTATDGFGRSTTVERMLDPRTIDYVVASEPAGLRVTFDSTTAAAPIERTVIDGSTHSVATTTPQNGLLWQGWSDGGSLTHQVQAGTASTGLTALFAAPFDPGPDPPVTPDQQPPAAPEPPDADHPTPRVMCDGVRADVVGTREGETLLGTADDDVIAGRGGADQIRGRGGDDTICGAAGRDTLRGGGGSDLLNGGGGRDRCVEDAADKLRSCP